MLEGRAQHVVEDWGNDAGKYGVQQAAGQLGKHGNRDGVRCEPVYKTAHYKGLEHIQSHIDESAEDAGNEDNEVFPGPQLFFMRRFVSDERSDKGDHAFCNEGNERLGAVTGNEIKQERAEPGGQETACGPKEKPGKGTQTVGQVQRGSHKGNAQVVDDKNNGSHHADERDTEGGQVGTVFGLSHGGPFFH